MKSKVIKNILLLVLCSSTILSLNLESVQAIWKQDSQNRWYWNENGINVTGWKLIQEKWYFFYNNGIMASGWLKEGDKWYYLNTTGEMRIGWFKDIDGKWYHLSSSGSMNTGWLKDSNEKWYYLSDSGAMVTGWIILDGNKYYLEPNGEMATGKITIDGKEYDFGESGALTEGDSSVNDPSLDKEESIPDGSIVEEIRKKAYVVTESSPLNMRLQPSSDSKVVITIPKNSEVTVIGKENNGFYKVEYNNKTGYASSKWISFDKPQADNGNNNESSSGNTNITLGSIRTTGPEKNNIHYYSDDNIFYKVKLSPPFTNSSGKPIVGNCTWYAYGRIWEMTGHIPYDAGFTGNGYEWWNANIRSGKYKYGQTPKKGALAVWKSSLPNSGGCGHVAIIEKIENNKIYISESSWHGSYFNYREIYSTDYLYGYIYLDEPNF